MTSCTSSIAKRSQHRLLSSTTLFGDRTAGVKAATAGRIQRCWNIAAENDPLRSQRGIGDRNCADQSLRVGMLRTPANLFRSTNFNKLSQIHYSDPPRELLDDRNGVADEEIGQPERSLKFPEQRCDLCLNGNIEGRYGFVSDNQFGFESQSSSDPNALALPTTEFMGIPVHRRSVQPHDL